VPELITTSPKAYKELAIDLALNPEKLKQLKGKVQINRLTTALFDPVGNTRHIENAFIEMYRRYAAGEQPNDFIVQP
jgi:predicted O-linked N-acetylglucosamine transferase (SPINDLY family)